MVLTNLR